MQKFLHISSVFSANETTKQVTEDLACMTGSDFYENGPQRQDPDDDINDMLSLQSIIDRKANEKD